MSDLYTIQVFEYGWLVEGQNYISAKTGKEVEFTSTHFQLLSKYLTLNSSCPYYSLYYDRVHFCNYVGVIKVGNLTIEVLPKTDRHHDDKKVWQNVLLKMLAISLQVQAKTTTQANIHIRKHSVLDTYLHLFLDEVDILVHQGLTKKYRKEESNQTALKGKLLIHQQVTKNSVHAERFFVAHQVYDRNNIYNAILFETLNCIRTMNVSDSLSKRCSAFLLDFPECSSLKVSEKFFSRLRYDRKTERYKNAIELARIILLHYHPDIKGGSNHILAIMFDMNLLWESYIYYKIRRASAKRDVGESVKGQEKKLFWHREDNWSLRLKPDIIIRKGDTESTIVIDTKWKYQSGTSIQDVRQMYAYGNYFEANQNYLLYPDNIGDVEKIKIKKGDFYKPGSDDSFGEISCGLMFADLLDGDQLNDTVGEQILKTCFPE